MPNKSTAPKKRMPFPFRGVAGGLLAASITAGSIFLFNIGSIEAPRAADFHFSRGVNFSTGEEDRLKGFLAGIAAEDRIHLRITGHTGTKGDQEANQNLSRKRATKAASIATDLGIPIARVSWTGGIGGAAPLPRSTDESEREWERKLSRVTVEAFVSK